MSVPHKSPRRVVISKGLLFVTLVAFSAFSAFSPMRALASDGATTTTTTNNSDKSAPATEAPSLVIITRFDEAGTVIVGQPISAELVAEIRGVTPDGDVRWDWGTPSARLEKKEAKDGDESKQTEGFGSYDFDFRITGSGTAIQSWTFKTPGTYWLNNHVAATFEVDGQTVVLRSEPTSENKE